MLFRSPPQAEEAAREIRRLLAGEADPLPPRELEAAVRRLVDALPEEALAGLGVAPPPRPEPPAPRALAGMAMAERVAAWQAYLAGFQYNHTATSSFFNTSKNRALCRILDTAREISRVRPRAGRGRRGRGLAPANPVPRGGASPCPAATPPPGPRRARAASVRPGTRGPPRPPPPPSARPRRRRCRSGASRGSSWGCS